jgi:hypothetical protein
VLGLGSWVLGFTQNPPPTTHHPQPKVAPYHPRLQKKAYVTITWAIIQGCGTQK